MFDEENYSIRLPLRKEKGWKFDGIVLAIGIYSEYNIYSLYFDGGRMGKLISIVIPCYNEEKTINIICEAIQKTMEQVDDIEYELLLVNDGSSDDTLEKMQKLAEKNTRIKYYSFSRNFGKEAAIYAGLCNAKGDYVVTMDADMQDPPELLPKMLEILETEPYDSVATRRVSRAGEPLVRSAFARIFYKLINRISDAEIVDGARDYRLMTRAMVQSVLSLSEYNRFSKGIFAWVGYRTKWIEYENVKRVDGETKWSFWKLLKYSIDGIVNFSNVPLMISSYLGIAMTFVSFLAIVFIIVRKMIFGDPVSGWPSLACIITFVGGIQLFCMGIMGQYLSKTYMEVKKRPHYVICCTNDDGAQKNK
jgi:glucosyltransferase